MPDSCAGGPDKGAPAAGYSARGREAAEILSSNRQSGVSIIAAIFVIVILAFMGVMFLSLATTGTRGSLNTMLAKQAFYIASGGLESAVYSLTTPVLSDRTTCSSVTGSAAFTAKPLGQGQFTVSGTAAYSSPPRC